MKLRIFLSVIILLALLQACSKSTSSSTNSAPQQTDTGPYPQAISDVTVTGAGQKSIELTFTAPQADANGSGVSGYEIRYLVRDISDQTWEFATLASDPPALVNPGETQTVTISGLDYETVYYVAVKSYDAVDNYSALSNVVSAATLEETFSYTYEVGPGKTYATPNDLPWESLQPGSLVLIYHRTEPYACKWGIGAGGSETARVVVRGVPNSQGDLPVITGENAVTRLALDYVNETRGLIKIGTMNIPSITCPTYVEIANLHIKNAHPDFSFTDSDGTIQSYDLNAAAIYIEAGSHVTIKNCILEGSGNGIFIGSYNGMTSDILISGNDIYGNGISGSAYEHNTYTAATRITYEFNHFGPLLSGALGNNIKDRSAGLIVRYNWIDSGNRGLDLVESDTLYTDPAYGATFVYGNIIIEPDSGNSQVIHYGGDSGTESQYRKGVLYFANNTVISYRTGTTTLFRLSTNDETARVWNNIFYNQAGGTNLALLSDSGVLTLTNNWLNTGYVDTFSTLNGTITETGNITGTDPQFADFANEDFHLTGDSEAINKGISTTEILGLLLFEYKKHTGSEERAIDSNIDLGAFEFVQ